MTAREVLVTRATVCWLHHCNRNGHSVKQFCMGFMQLVQVYTVFPLQHDRVYSTVCNKILCTDHCTSFESGSAFGSNNERFVPVENVENIQYNRSVNTAVPE